MNLLNSIKYLKRGLHAWLSPSGELFRIGYFEHEIFAEEVVKKSSTELENSGWLRISDNNVTSKYSSGHIRLTEHQIYLTRLKN
ncbi:MAG: hypothetical protein ACOC56_00345 [Atribacterota bacterium]